MLRTNCSSYDSSSCYSLASINFPTTDTNIRSTFKKGQNKVTPLQSLISGQEKRGSRFLGKPHKIQLFTDYSMIVATRPDPTILPPSRIVMIFYMTRPPLLSEPMVCFLIQIIRICKRIFYLSIRIVQLRYLPSS